MKGNSYIHDQQQSDWLQPLAEPLPPQHVHLLLQNEEVSLDSVKINRKLTHKVTFTCTLGSN